MKFVKKKDERSFSEHNQFYWPHFASGCCMVSKIIECLPSAQPKCVDNLEVFTTFMPETEFKEENPSLMGSEFTQWSTIEVKL